MGIESLLLPITGLFAGLCGLLLATLSLRVIAIRRTQRISLGTGGNDMLERRVRAQGNAVEYMPIMLILIAVGELNGLYDPLLLAIGGLFMIGRVLHGWAFSFSSGNMVARVGGMHLTLWPLIGLGGWNLLVVLKAFFA